MTTPETPLGELRLRGREAMQGLRASSLEAEQATRDRLSAGRQRWNHSGPGRAVNEVVDWFFKWLFDWGLGDDVTIWSPQRPPTAKEIQAGVDAALAAQEEQMRAEAERAMKERQEAADATRQHDAPAASAQDDPTDRDYLDGAQDLDAVVDGVEPPPPVADEDGHTPPPLVEHYDTNPNWCNCTDMASCTHERAGAIGDFDVDDLLPPDPGAPASEPEPAATNL